MDKLGIEPLQLLTQTFNFFVMVIVLTKFLYKPILKALEERKKKIEEGLQYAEEMKEELAKNEKVREDIINKAKDEAKKIVEEGKKTGSRLEEEIIAKAQMEAKNILEKGRQEIELERLKMEKDLRSQTIYIVFDVVEAVLGKIIDLKTQRKIIAKKIQEIAKIAK